MSDERRKARRTRLSGARATYEGASGEAQQAGVVDLSAEGVFLETASQLGIGKRISLEIFVSGQTTPWPALGRVVWSRAGADGAERPRGMAVKLIDVEDDVLAAMERWVGRREQTEPGIGEVEAPAHEQTILGVGAEVAPNTAPPKPAASARLDGFGTGTWSAGAAATPSGGLEISDHTIAIDLVVRKSDARLRGTDPAANRWQGLDEETFVIPKRSGGIWMLFLLLIVVVGVAAYMFRERLQRLEFIRSWMSQLDVARR